MKSFFYIIKQTKAKFGSNITNTVYQIVKNKPVFIGEANYNTGSFRGHNHEAATLIVDKKKMPKTILDNGYIDYDKLDKVYSLAELS